MILDENHIEKFEKYVNGQMEDQENDAFEELLRTNDELRVEFYIFSDMLDDINIIANHELKNQLNKIHKNFNTNYQTKENKIRRLYYGLGMLFFMLILFTVYFMAAHHLKTHPEDKKEVPVTDSIKVMLDNPIEKQATPESIEVKITPIEVNVLTQTLNLTSEYTPEKSYSFSSKGLELYGVNKTNTPARIIKDKDRFYLKINNVLYMIEKTEDKIVRLERTKPPYKSIIENKNGVKIPVYYIPTLDSMTIALTTIVFKEEYKANQISIDSEVIYLSKSLHPLQSIKRQKDESLIISRNNEAYIFNASNSPDLQIWTEPKKSPTEYTTLMDSFLENDYLEENSF